MTKASAELTLFDLLSRLTFLKAVKLLGAEGQHLIDAGGKYDIDIVTQVAMGPDEFRLALGLAGAPPERGPAEPLSETALVAQAVGGGGARPT